MTNMSINIWWIIVTGRGVINTICVAFTEVFTEVFTRLYKSYRSCLPGTVGGEG